MNTNDNLDSMTDAALSEAFAREYLGREVKDGMMRLSDSAVGGDWFESWIRMPQYATSITITIPHLNDRGRWKADYSVTSEPPGAEFMVLIHKGHHQGYAPTFARAACIALLRAKRAEKGQP